MKLFESQGDLIHYLQDLEASKTTPMMVKAACLDIIKTSRTTPLRMIKLLQYVREDGYSFNPTKYDIAKSLPAYVGCNFPTSFEVKEFMRLHEEDRELILPHMISYHRSAYDDIMNGLIPENGAVWKEGGFGIPPFTKVQLPKELKAGTNFTKHIFMDR